MNGLIRNTGRAALVAAIVALAAPAAMADTATYNIGVAGLINQANDCCGGGQRYNGCGGEIGWTWSDTLAAGDTVTAVDITIHSGVECGGNSSYTTVLNGSAQGSYVAPDNCDCCAGPSPQTASLDASAYNKGGSNTVMTQGVFTCSGTSPINGDYAVVTVTFDPEGGGGGGGDIGGKLDAIEVKLDELGGVGSKLDAIEVKLDNFDGSGCDLSGVISKLDAIEVKLDNLDIGEGIGSKLDAIETKLDDETRFTDDTELGDSQNVIVGEINQNEVKIDALEAKADEAGTSLDALEAKADAAAGALDALEVKADEAGTSLDALEVKADEAGTSLDALEVKADEAATSLDALEAKADTAAGALDALEVKADLAAEALAALEAKVDKINFDELIRIHIEEDMLLHDRISHFYLPEAFGGRLEMVSAIVFDTIIQNQAAGIDTGNALDSWNDGEAARAAGEWKDAWDAYVQAYRMVVTGG